MACVQQLLSRAANIVFLYLLVYRGLLSPLTYRSSPLSLGHVKTFIMSLAYSQSSCSIHGVFMACSYPHNTKITHFCQNFAFLLGLLPACSAYQPPQYIFSGYALSGYRSFRKSLHSVVPCFPLACPLPYRASLLTLGNIQEILTLLSLTRSLIISLGTNSQKSARREVKQFDTRPTAGS